MESWSEAPLKHIKSFLFSNAQQQELLENLSTLIEDGAAVAPSLELMAKINSGTTVEVIDDLRNEIAAGGSLANALEGWYPPSICSLIQIGEESGTLGQSLKAAVAALTRKGGVFGIIVSALAYPLTVVVAGCAVSIYINHSVLVSFRDIAPITSWPIDGQWFVAFADFMQHAWWVIVIVIMAMMISMGFLLRYFTGDVRDFIDGFPILNLYRALVAGSFMSTLGLLIENGFSLRKGLEVIRSRSYGYLKWHIEQMEENLTLGKTAAEVLDTGLVSSNDILRMHIVTRGRGFDAALIRQGLRSQEQAMKALKRSMMIAGGILMALGAGLAVFMIKAIYGVGMYLGTAAAA